MKELSLNSPVTELDLPNIPVFKTGKVRVMYDLGDELLMVATDRVSSFDFILPNGIPDKGAVLTAVSAFWFEKTRSIIGNHLISSQFDEFPDILHPHRAVLERRSLLVKKTALIPVEAVVRGYLLGSGWVDYQRTGMVCGESLPSGLVLADRLPTPLFTPAIKADTGHDENISFSLMCDKIGTPLASRIRDVSLALYRYASDYALKRGIIIADTKFEFGLCDGELILIDEALTPDSSRFWDAQLYRPGVSPPSFDKQIVRDYLLSIDWDKHPPVPILPDDVVEKVRKRYLDVQRLLLSCEDTFA